jgi:ParB family chromosome partitioning protein
MAKIKYKELSPEMAKLAAPASHWSGRSSVGMEEKVREYYQIPLTNLRPFSKQARRVFNSNELQQLADTIKEHGIRQPLSIIPSLDDDGTFEVISGERRLRAAQIAGLENVPCIILKDRTQAEELALIENIQRADLHPVELGDAYASILSGSKHGSISELAQKVGKPISSVSEHTKLSKLPAEIKAYLIEHNIRAKPLFRKILATHNINEIKNMLGMVKTSAPIINKSVLRVTLNANEFSVEARQIKKLNETQRNELKKALLSLVETL